MNKWQDTTLEDLKKWGEKRKKRRARYCKNCKQTVEPKEANIFIVLILLFFGLIFWGLLIIMFLYILFIEMDKRCPICNGKNWRIPPKKRK